MASKLYKTGSDFGWNLASKWAKASRVEKRAILAKLKRMDEAGHNAFVRGLFGGIWERADLCYQARLASKAARLQTVIEKLV